MNSITVSATKARNNFFSLLDEVAKGKEVVIEKDKKIVAVLKPQKQGTDWKALRKSLDATYGLLKDYTVEEIAPTRKKGAWGDFGNWDKGIDFTTIKKKK
ncbi:MAG: type II toxin-antitoxin system prevent-host-death family antitoxin [Candidatus Levybacteria bacterium]|nr:type II toxin-antitoxin system prevent-host-death family antitoxin [Candidatus Levybacteria bacterium]